MGVRKDVHCNNVHGRVDSTTTDLILKVELIVNQSAINQLFEMITDCKFHQGLGLSYR
jgi:hypothetical protein